MYVHREERRKATEKLLDDVHASGMHDTQLGDRAKIRDS